MLTFVITQPDGSLFSLDFVPQANPLEIISTLRVTSSTGNTFNIISDQSVIDSTKVFRQYFSVVYQSEVDFSVNFTSIQADCLEKFWQNTIFNTFNGTVNLMLTYFNQIKFKILF